jgi:hypothetical protein
MGLKKSSRKHVRLRAAGGVRSRLPAARAPAARGVRGQLYAARGVSSLLPRVVCPAGFLPKKVLHACAPRAVCAAGFLPKRLLRVLNDCIKAERIQQLEREVELPIYLVVQ